MKVLIKEFKECQDCLNTIKNFNYIILNFSNFGSIDEKIKTSWFSCASSADMLTWIFDEQSQNLQSLQISEIIENIKEEEKHFDSGDEDNGALGEQLKISDEQERTILWSKSHIWIQIVQIKNQLQKMKTDSTGQSDKQNKLETQLKNLWQNYQHFKMKMSYWGSEQTLSKPINVDYQSPQSIDPNDRWNLYFYWMNLYKDFVEKKFLELRYEHRQLSQKIIEIRNMLDLEIMKRALVLGMTFTSLARLQATLESLKCRIVVVEEACTVSESQIVVSLTKHCENLILLGKHLELCPTVGKSNYSLGSNVMERMMRNGLQSHSLRVQHRIRPEIVELLVPLNYPELENHHSVTKFPPVLGIPSCNYFVHHEHQDDEEYNSKTNLYEATFLVNLARYLMHAGYQPEDITILASYSGQMETLHDESEKHEDLLKSVRICTLDSYPNEECKIVLLSLVRNNADGKIGRLGFEDFVISALSRAKEALYMMGNINLLSENSEMWAKIKEVLVKQNCLGDYLPVCCKVNSYHITKIKEPKDYDEVLENACSKICGTLLQCGHRCSKRCHSLEDDHATMECTAVPD